MAPFLETKDAEITKISKGPSGTRLIEIMVKYHERGFMTRFPLVVPIAEFDEATMVEGQQLKVTITPYKRG